MIYLWFRLIFLEEYIQFQKNQSFLIFISSFTASLTPSINTPKSCNDFIIFISFISSFEINTVNPFPALTAPFPLKNLHFEINTFPALTAPFPLIFLSNLFVALEVELLTNPGILSLAKEEPRDPPGWIIVDISPF